MGVSWLIGCNLGGHTWSKLHRWDCSQQLATANSLLTPVAANDGQEGERRHMGLQPKGHVFVCV
eukprot:28031-Pelagomonas_calceolata.AAC.1